jgi:hypothetical protein
MLKVIKSKSSYKSQNNDIVGSFKNRVTGTEIFKSDKNSDILLLKKKHPADNLSKDLIVSGYTLEDIPSLQICREENLIVYSKSNLTSFHCPL